MRENTCVLGAGRRKKGENAVGNARKLVTRAAILLALTGTLLLVLATPVMAGS